MGIHVRIFKHNVAFMQAANEKIIFSIWVIWIGYASIELAVSYQVCIMDGRLGVSGCDGFIGVSALQFSYSQCIQWSENCSTQGSSAVSYNLALDTMHF